MLKIIFCLKRRDHLTLDEFHQRWKEHAAIVREAAQVLGIRRNVHRRTIPLDFAVRIREGRGLERDDYDGVAESWFDSVEALQRAASTEEGRRAAKRIADDEGEFVDFSRSRVFFVEEEVMIG